MREYVYFGANHATLVDVTKPKLHCSELVLEEAAQQKLTGGYNKRNVLCTGCGIKKSVTGECYC